MDHAYNKSSYCRRLDQFYTDPEVAAYLFDLLLSRLDQSELFFVEPSAGMGAFSDLFPLNSAAFDIDPKAPGIIKADFLRIELPHDQKIAVVGNPPFGKNSSLAVRFFNHAAINACLIAFIVPKTFKKNSIQRRLNPFFHLAWEDPVPDDAFWFCGKRKHVPTVFQTWIRRDEKRNEIGLPTSHPDFEFLPSGDGAEFVIRRVGGKAGSISYNSDASPASHLFIKPKVAGVEERFRSLDFVSAANLTAGKPSLAKSDIVRLYSDLRRSQTS